MAKLLKENEFVTQIHEGEKANIYIRLVGNRVILVVIFDSRSSIGLGVRAGSPKPDVSSAEGVKRSLLAVKSFARNEGAESGKHMLAVFDRLGIAEEMKAKTKAMPVNTGYVAELVLRGEADMAAQQMPELKAVAGIDASPLPKELQQIIVFSAGLSSKPGDPKAAQELVAFLTSAEAAPVLKAKGLDPP